MDQFTLSSCADGSWGELAKRCADDIAAQQPARDRTLGFVYATDALADDMGSIVTFLRERTGIETWVGTVGHGVCATGQAWFDEPALVTLAAPLPPGSFRLLDGKAAADPGEARQPGIVVVHGDPREEATLDALDTVTRDGAYAVGGLTASQGEHPQVAGGITEGGLSGVALSAELPVAVGLTQGTVPTGPVHRVTEAEGQVIAALEGRPALEVLLEECGDDAQADLAARLEGMHAARPVRGSDTGDYVVRNLLGVGVEDGWIAISEEMSPGDRLLFCRRDGESAVEDMERMLVDLKQRTGAPPSGGLYFSCVARGPNMFDPPDTELTMIREVLGDFPLAGFFGNGEFAHDRLYGYTGVLLLFL